MPSILVPGAVFDGAASSLTIPDRTDLVSEHVLLTNNAQAIRNLGRSGTPGAVVGAPTYDVDGAAVSSVNYINTQLPAIETDQTFACLAKNIAGGGSLFAAPAYLGLLYGVAGNSIYYYNGEGGVATAAIAKPATASHIFIIGWGRALGKGSVQLGAAGALGAAVESAANAPTPRDASLVDIGSHAYNAATAKIKWAARFKRLLDADERLALYLSLRDYFDDVY